MIKLHAHIQKKVPLPGHDYSSQSYSAGLEVEVADNDNPAVIQDRIRQLYALLNSAVEEQLAQTQAPANGQQHAEPQQRTPRIPAAGNGNGQRGNRRGQVVPATQAQIRAIKSIASEQGLDLAEVLAPFHASCPEDLTIKDASAAIDNLKVRKANGNRR